MENYTDLHPPVLTLGFGEMTSMRYLYGIVAFLVYVMVIFFNCSVIMAVLLHKTLQEPMYIFVSMLCLNGIYGTTSFLPYLVFGLLSNLKTITYTGCLIQVFCLHTYAGGEMITLTIMAYDRYVCICNPLRYNSIMTLATVFKLVVSAWLYTIVMVGINLVLTIQLPLCDSTILKVYCDNWSVVRLSCVDITVSNLFGLLTSSTFTGLMPVLIITSYILILKVCIKSSKDFRAKALQTCMPHLITIVNYAFNLFFEILIHRFIPEHLNFEFRTIMSVQLLVAPPLLNPVIYGLKVKEMRGRILQMLHQNAKTMKSVTL
ncbi:olfactory receptor 51E1-like [Leptodactylus fuscus]|uniref:olfactory receptor 51E1-like n=1 Tax=Leptodactylus fuscus TaxID=238119 RepID=UPI003F4EB1F9